MIYNYEAAWEKMCNTKEHHQKKRKQTLKQMVIIF